MTRNLKALGLALAAVLALGAIGASAASAQSDPQGELTTETGEPVTLDVTESAEVEAATVLTAFGGSMSCDGTAYMGHRYDETPHELVPNGSSAITLTPQYAEPCPVSGGRQMTINTHGCDFVLELGATAPTENMEGTYATSTDIVCPDPEKGITLTTFSNPPPEAEGTDLCTQEITGGELNEGLEGLHVRNAPGSGELTDRLDLSGTVDLHIERNGLCLFDGKGSTTNVGEFHIDVVVAGTNELEEELGIAVSDGPLQGKFSGGPVTLDMTETGKEGANGLTAFESSVECSGSFYTGHKVDSSKLLQDGETSATISPTYKQPCAISGGRLGTVAMNGCDFVLGLGEEAGGAHTFDATTDIVCPAEKAVHISWYGGSDTEHESRLCTIEIGPQSGLGGAHVTTNTEGTDDFSLTGAFEEVHVERTGLCVFDGKGSTTAAGAIDVDATVQGTDAMGEVIPVGVSG